MFITPEKLQEKQVLHIGEALENIARKCIGQKERVKTKSWGFEQDSIKYVAQECLDDILNLAYPYISRAKKLTDMKQQLSYDGLLKFRLLPELLPMGHNQKDRTQLIVGVQTDKKGEKSVARIGVWRHETHVYFEYKGIRISNPIISESEPVDMVLPCPGPFTLSATGEAKEKYPWLLGDYSLNVNELDHRGHPVYRHSKYYRLFSLKDGGWGVTVLVGNSVPVMRSTSPAPSPALCQHWEYKDDGKYKPGDIKVTFIN